VGKSAEQARQELVKLNIEYSTDSFVKRVAEADLVVVDLFLRTGMNPNAVDKNGKTALLVAIDGGHKAIVEKLIQAGADVNLNNVEGSREDDTINRRSAQE
jgi:ankyrin repeat protein